MNKNSLDKKGLVVAVILLFIGMSVIPSIESAKTEKYTEGENPLFNYNHDPPCYPVFNGTKDNGGWSTSTTVKKIKGGK